MTTNQTIDNVPRELLERIREKLSQTDYTWSANDPKEELRALLDAPGIEVRDKCGVQMVDCPECSHQWDHFFECGNGPANPKPTGLSQGWNLTRKHDGFVVGHQSVAYPPDEKAIERAERDGYVWVPFLVPAAQPQGEPVAYADPKAFENFGSLAHLGGLYAKEWMWATPAPGLVPLYAEQPAPVAFLSGGRQAGKSHLAALLESLAQQIYDSWQTQPGWVPWKEGMYGSKQNEARQIASRMFELALANQVGD